MVPGSTRKLLYSLVRGVTQQSLFNGRPCPLLGASSSSSSPSSSWLSLMMTSMDASEERRWSSTHSSPPPPLQTSTRNILTIHNEKPNIIDIKEILRKQQADSTTMSPEQATKIRLRPAKPDDCGSLIKLIRNFAELEDKKPMLEITEEDLLRDGFGDMPFFQCVVAEAEGVDNTTSLVAYSLYNFIYCGWKGRMVTIEDIFVHAAYRGLGLGAILLHEVSRHGYNLGCRRVSGYVDKNDPNLPRWYQGYGFVDFTHQFEYHIYSLSDASLDKFVKENDPFTKPNTLGLDIASTL